MHEPLDPHLFGEDQPCFGCGPRHPIGFRLRFSRGHDEVRTAFVPGTAYQGPPGIVHGGLVLTLADEVAAWTVVGLLGKFGFTAKVDAKLHKPVRVGAEVVATGRITRPGSRVVEVGVELRQEDVLACEGSFRFVILDEGAAEKLLGGPLPEAWRKLAR